MDYAISDYTVVLPTAGFTKTGYILAGWTIDGLKYDLGEEYVLSSDATASAVWERNTQLNPHTVEEICRETTIFSYT